MVIVGEKTIYEKIFVLIISSMFIGLVCSCGVANDQTIEGEDKDTYTQISQEEATKMMAEDDGHVIVDVRRQDEYDEGHIPGAICIPNESITDSQPEELSDLNQVILVYCRTGRRSKEAAQKLYDIGYTNIYEFGGISTWPGEITTED